jgi:hypothetical protein
VLLSKSQGLFATVFTANGSFLQRKQVIERSVRFTEITEAAVPAAITNYLTTTYPNYVFKKAFRHLSISGVTTGYVVLIDANSTKYAVEFGASGNFLKVKIIY